jgi:hypothetical protein
VDGSLPEPVVYIHQHIQAGLRIAQQMVISKMDRFENDQGFTETFNQSALRYRTNLVNTLFRGFFKWQARTLLAELRRPDSPYANCKIKGLLHFLVNAMSRAIVRANPVQPELYSSLDIKNYHGLENDPFCLEIVQRHGTYLTDSLVHARENDEKLHPKLGVATEKLIERMPHLYLGYALFLQKETGRLEALVATPEKRARLRTNSGSLTVVGCITENERSSSRGV